MEAAEQLAGLGFAGHDGGLSRFRGRESAVPGVETQVGFAAVRVHAVAFEAVAGEEWPDLAVEVKGGVRGCGRRRGNPEGGQCNKQEREAHERRGRRGEFKNRANRV
jgi:hypothetical protein